MGLGEMLRDKPMVGIALAVVMLLLAGVMTMRGRGGKGLQFHYDLQSGELVAFAAREAPPVTLPSGNKGVLAYVFACGDCASNEQFVGYLLMYSEDAKRQLMTEAQGPAEQLSPLIARKPESPGEEPVWVSAQSRQGGAIIQTAYERCGGSGVRECFSR